MTDDSTTEGTTDFDPDLTPKERSFVSEMYELRHKTSSAIEQLAQATAELLRCRDEHGIDAEIMAAAAQTFRDQEAVVSDCIEKEVDHMVSFIQQGGSFK